MTVVPAACATLFLAAFAWLVGRPLARVVAPDAAPSLAGEFALGLVTVHAMLQALAVAGLPWHWSWLLALAVVAGVATFAAQRRNGAEDRVITEKRSNGWGWGDAVALALVLVFAGLALAAWIDNPDFVYHWGVKGRRFALAGGLDTALLTSRSAWHIHPDYPNLLPELFSWTIRLGGAAEGGQLLWSAVFLAALLLAAREALAALGVARPARQIVLAGTAAALVGFGCALWMAGNADWCIAWALLLAIVPLCAPRAPGAWLRLGAAAALAASAKIEGVPLALLLLAAFGVQRLAAEGWRGARVSATAALPALAVIAPWWWICRRLALFQPTNAGTPSWERFLLAAPWLLDGLLSAAWCGLGLTIVLLPWLAFSRRVRWPALVAIAQLAFYLYVYVSAPVGTVLYVQTSWTRLLLHLLPVTWVLAMAALERPPASGEV